VEKLNKRLMVIALAIILVVAISVSALYLLQSPGPTPQPPVPTPQPEGEQFLNFTSNYQGGAETKVYLVNSTLFYGVYEESFTRSGATGFYSIAKGNPCVVINGTIRNDYDKDYYFSLTADVLNSGGEKIGPILTVESPQPGFTVAFVEKGATGHFTMQIKYEPKDIADYSLFVAFEPYDSPPP